MYSAGVGGLGDTGPSNSSYQMGNTNTGGILQNSGKMGSSFNSGSTAPGG